MDYFAHLPADVNTTKRETRVFLVAGMVRSQFFLMEVYLCRA